MRCLVVTPHRYGIREVAERVGEEWASMGNDVAYVLARGDAARIGPVTVGTPGIAYWWDRKLRGIAAELEQYDLIWAHQPVAPRLPTGDPAFWSKVIVTFHTTLRAEYRLAREGVYPPTRLPFHWLTKTLEARFYRRLSARDGRGPAYTVVSPHLCDEISAFGIEEATYVPNGIFGPAEDDQASIRTEYGIPEDATLVFNVGSLTPQKRADRFARVLRAVVDRRDDVYCAIAGKGPLGEAVARQAAGTERLIVTGYVSDEEKWRWFADADLFASLAAYEGMPVATLEALSFGVPVILSDIPAHRNVVDRHDTTGVVVESTPDAVEAAIDRLAGQRASVSLPDWSGIATSYLDLLR